MKKIKSQITKNAKIPYKIKIYFIILFPASREKKKEKFSLYSANLPWPLSIHGQLFTYLTGQENRKEVQTVGGHHHITGKGRCMRGRHNHRCCMYQSFPIVQWCPLTFFTSFLLAVITRNVSKQRQSSLRDQQYCKLSRAEANFSTSSQLIQQIFLLRNQPN